MGKDVWCQNDVILPKELPAGKPYTLYWVWDWATSPGADPSLPKGKAQTYTTCMDVDITASQNSNAKSNAAINFAQGQDINNAAVPAYISKLAAGDANLATPAQSAGSPGGSVPASSAIAASSAAVASQPSSSGDGKTVFITLLHTVTVSAGAPQVTSTSTTEVPRSTVQLSESANPSASIPQISLKLSGTAKPAQETGNPSRRSAKFRV